MFLATGMSSKVAQFEGWLVNCTSSSTSSHTVLGPPIMLMKWVTETRERELTLAERLYKKWTQK